MKFRQQSFDPRELRSLGTPPADQPPLRIGDYARLNSGGAPMLVVDADIDTITLSWRDRKGAHEESLPRACVRRADQS